MLFIYSSNTESCILTVDSARFARDSNGCVTKCELISIEPKTGTAMFEFEIEDRATITLKTDEGTPIASYGTRFPIETAQEESLTQKIADTDDLYELADDIPRGKALALAAHIIDLHIDWEQSHEGYGYWDPLFVRLTELARENGFKPR